MKYLAKINLEFLKEARKWDDLSYDEQKGYIKRHPKSKRKLTARPDTSQPATVGTLGQLPQALYDARIEKAKDRLQKGYVIAVRDDDSDMKYFKLDIDGRLWSSSFENTDWKLHGSQKIPESISRGLYIIGPQLQTTHISNNEYFKTTKPIPAWIKTGTKPSNTWYGAANILTTVYDRVTLPVGTPIQILAGGNFAVINDERKGVRFTDPKADPGVFEKQYGVDHTRIELPLSALARTNEIGAITHKPNKLKFSFKTDEQIAVEEKLKKQSERYGKINKAIKDSNLTKGEIETYNIGNAFAKKVQKQGDVYLYTPNLTSDNKHKHEIMSYNESSIDKLKDELSRVGVYSEKEKQEVMGGDNQFILKLYDEETEKKIKSVQQTRINKQRARLHVKELQDSAAVIDDLSNVNDVKEWMSETEQNFSKNEILKDFPNFYDYDAEQIANVHKEMSSADKDKSIKHMIDVVKKNEEKTGSFDVNRIAKGLKSIPFLNDGWMHDDEPDIEKNFVQIGIRDLGTWISRPGEEDDDYPSWSDKSAEKYSKRFKEWANNQSWFDPNTMEAVVTDGEKSWAYFRIKQKKHVAQIQVEFSKMALQQSTLNSGDVIKIKSIPLQLKNDTDVLGTEGNLNIVMENK